MVNVPHHNMITTTPFETIQEYLSLIANDYKIQLLLHCDTNNQVIDKWLVAMVYEYFQRAKLLPHHYSREKFFIALYLAIEFEEDEDRKIKDVLLDFLLNQDYKTFTSKRQFVKKKDKLWKKLGFRCMVMKKRLEQIISMFPYHNVWKRERRDYLSGANRTFTCQIEPVALHLYKFPQHKILGPPPAPLTPKKAPIVIDLTGDSPPPVRRTSSAAYRYLNRIVRLIEHDRGRRRPPVDIMKMKHVQHKRLSDLQMLDTLARTNSFSQLGSELAHLSMNTFNTMSGATFGYNTMNNMVSYNDNPELPGLILLPDQRVSFPMFMDLSPLVVPVVPRTDHWV